MTGRNSSDFSLHTKCHTCRKKVHIVFSCRCGKKYCQVHLPSDVHNCTFDYVRNNKKHLEKVKPVIKDKIQRI